MRGLPSGLGPEVVERVREVLARVASVEHEHLAAPIRLLEDGQAVVLPVGERGSLASHPGLAGWERAGEVVTIFWPVAEALVAVHEAGLAHGTLAESRILLSAEGRPTLAGVGLADVLAAADPEQPTATPDDDVRVLAGLVLKRLGPQDSWGTDVDEARAARLADLVTRSRTAEPHSEPATMRDLADLIGLLADPRPVRTGQPLMPLDTAALGLPTTRRWVPGTTSLRRLGVRRALVGACAAVLVVSVGALAGEALLGSDGTTAAAPCPDGSSRATNASQPTPSELTSPGTDQGSASTVAAPAGETAGSPLPGTELATPDWVGIVQKLHDRRALAWQTADSSLLCEVYVPGSPGLASDQAALAALAAADAGVDGIGFRVTQASLTAQADTWVRLLITDSLPDYRVVRGNDSQLARGVPEGTWQAELQRDEAGNWRFR